MTIPAGSLRHRLLYLPAKPGLAQISDEFIRAPAQLAGNPGLPQGANLQLECIPGPEFDVARRLNDRRAVRFLLALKF